MTRAPILILALVLAGCAAAVPTPTSEPTPTPTAEPTPQVVTVEVEVTPRACLDAIDDLLDAEAGLWELVTDLLEDYVDFPDENLEQFGVRVERRLTDFDPASLPTTPIDAITECRAAA